MSRAPAIILTSLDFIIFLLINLLKIHKFTKINCSYLYISNTNNLNLVFLTALIL